MKRQPKEIGALNLRRSLPEVALRMETDHLIHEAEKLGLVISVYRGKRIARIGIELTHYHTLRLSPVDKGAQGVGEWFTFMNHGDKCEHNHPEYIMRVHAEIIDQFGLGENQVESVTVVGTSIDMVLREALGAYEFLTGKGLAPRFYTSES
jgi:hypothetical protein